MSLKTSYFALCMNDSLAGYKIPILKVVVPQHGSRVPAFRMVTDRRDVN